MPPVIGISPCRLLADYVESVRRAGGEPHVLDVNVPPQIDQLDGMLFTGGGDIDPARYNESRHPKTEPADAARDGFELDLAKKALSKDLPVFGVCRGLQIMNVAAGGTLIQDIASQLTGPVEHRIQTPLYAIAHEVWITKGSRLSALMEEQLGESEVLQVNSRHHQAVGQVAAGFNVTATAPDGVIEAIERPDARFCLAVQWHPENFWRTGEFRPLFEEFVKACEK
jgi:putative glutamine amidotransferase